MSTSPKLIDLNKAHKDKENQIVNDVIILNNQTSQSNVHHSSKIKQFVECSRVKDENGNLDEQILIDEVNSNKSAGFKKRVVNNPYNPNSMFFPKKNSRSTPRINLMQNPKEIRTGYQDLLSYHAKSLQGVKPNVSKSPAKNSNRSNSKSVRLS